MKSGSKVELLTGPEHSEWQLAFQLNDVLRCYCPFYLQNLHLGLEFFDLVKQ